MAIRLQHIYQSLVQESNINDSNLDINIAIVIKVILMASTRIYSPRSQVIFRSLQPFILQVRVFPPCGGDGW